MAVGRSAALRALVVRAAVLAVVVPTACAQLEVLGLGFPRTGTDSLKEALDLLGYRTYHMKVAIQSRDDMRFWTDVFAPPVSSSSPGLDDGDTTTTTERRTTRTKASGFGEVRDALDAESAEPSPDYARIFDARNFTAAADLPFVGDWERLLRLYPHAKVVLTVRSAEAWWRSASTTVFPFFSTFPFNVIRRVDPFMRLFYAMSLNSWSAIMPFLREDPRGWRYCDVARDRRRALEAFEAHNRRVRSAVPPDRLLVFDVKQGWAPLCAFLGLEAPRRVPFPHVNSGLSFKLKRYAATAVLSGVLVALAWGGLVVARRVVRRRRRRLQKAA